MRPSMIAEVSTSIASGRGCSRSARRGRRGRAPRPRGPPRDPRRCRGRRGAGSSGGCARRRRRTGTRARATAAAAGSGRRTAAAARRTSPARPRRGRARARRRRRPARRRVAPALLARPSRSLVPESADDGSDDQSRQCADRDRERPAGPGGRRQKMKGEGPWTGRDLAAREGSQEGEDQPHDQLHGPRSLSAARVGRSRERPPRPRAA